MDDEDSLDVLQQIMQLNILDSQPQGYAESGPRGHAIEAAETCQTIVTGSIEVDKQKKKRGRPRKRVIYRRKKVASMSPADEPPSPIQLAHTRLIRATISPVPEQVPARSHAVHRREILTPVDHSLHDQEQGTQLAHDCQSDVNEILQQIMTSGILDPTHGKEQGRQVADDGESDIDSILQQIMTSGILDPTHGQEQGEKVGDDIDSDINDICHQIMTTGILDLSPHRSLSAMNSAGDSSIRRQSITVKPTEIGDRGKPRPMNHIIQQKPRRPRGRPAKKAIKQRQPLKTAGSINRLSVQHQCKSGNINVARSCYGEGELSQHSSIMERPRGRPKRRNVRARAPASQRQLMDESQFMAYEWENVDDKCMQEHTSWTPTPSETRIQDDEYRPSPPPPPTVHLPSPEVSPHTAAELSPEEIASRAMARPIFWTSVLDTWTTLASNEWLEATVADFYLTHVWYEMLDRSCMRYIDLHTSMATDISEEELALFRRNYLLPREGTCPVVPVGFIVHYSQHFFVAIFDYQRRHVYVLGRHISVATLQVEGIDPHNWCDWNGPEYWRRIAFLHGWSTGDHTDVSIMTRDWLQNGVDCGPIACSMLEQCLNSGLDKNGNLPDLDMQCGHILRIKMLRMLAGRVKLSCSDYLMLLDNPQAHWQEGDMPDEDIISMIQNGRHQAQCLKLLRTLIVLSSTCSMCQRRTPVQERTLPSYNSSLG
ncbi:hypothetical protein CY34DRAFT_111146, partial [Suillus luteus UH-Slu-Lm8-n1]